MKRLFWFAAGVFVATAWLTTGSARAEMVKGKITKIDGDTVTVKDDKGMEHTIHNDAGTTKRTGEVKVGAVVEADVTSTGHANAIMVKMEGMKKEEMKEKKEMKKETKKEKKAMKK